MKDKIIEIINQREDLALTAFKNHIPEAKGKYDFIFPVTGVENSNILLIGSVSENFIHAINELITNKVLTFEPCSYFIVIADVGEVYELPIVKTRKTSYKKLHWLPILIKKGENFPKLTLH